VFNPGQKVCKILRNYIIATLSPIISEVNICFPSQIKKSMWPDSIKFTHIKPDGLSQQAVGEAIHCSNGSPGRMKNINNSQADLQQARDCCGCSCEGKQDKLLQPAATAAWMKKTTA